MNYKVHYQVFSACELNMCRYDNPLKKNLSEQSLKTFFPVGSKYIGEKFLKEAIESKKIRYF